MFTPALIQRLHNRTKYKAQQSYQTSYREACQIRNIHKIREMKNSQTWVDRIEMPIATRRHDKMFQLKKSILNFGQYYEAKREVGPNKTS